MDYLTNPILSWRHVAGAVVVYYCTLVFYRLFLHPLARFPGPRLAAVSRWYEAYYDLIRGGQYTPKIAELHKQYGKGFSVLRAHFGPQTLQRHHILDVTLAFCK